MKVKVVVLYEPTPEYLLDKEYDKVRKGATGLGFDLFRVEYGNFVIRYTPHNDYIIAEIEHHGYYPIVFKIGKSLLWTKADKIEAVRKQDLKKLLEEHKERYGDGRVNLISDLKTLKDIIRYLYPKQWRRILIYLIEHYYYRLTNIKYLHELIKLLDIIEEECLLIKK